MERNALLINSIVEYHQFGTLSTEILCGMGHWGA